MISTRKASAAQRRKAVVSLLKMWREIANGLGKADVAAALEMQIVSFAEAATRPHAPLVR